jgi:hypothetical protein|nr:MAG TPA: hypothetical protein [Caudoviricetes sp.]
MTKEIIVARVITTGVEIFKSYVTNIKLVETRDIEGHKAGWQEKDYTFLYKGVPCRLNEHIVPDSNGEVVYSAKYRYEFIHNYKECE